MPWKRLSFLLPRRHIRQNILQEIAAIIHSFAIADPASQLYKLIENPPQDHSSYNQIS
jgi:hypothetical protein